MKLNIGENIRKRRREANMTQEELGDAIGVSYQAISRWENGSTYPDIELLPTLANYFSITVDELIGCGSNEKQKQAEELIEQLSAESKKEDPNPRRIISLIRELRRDHLDDIDSRFWYIMQKFYTLEGVLPELRLTMETVLDRGGNSFNRLHAIEFFFEFENEDAIKSFLDRFSPEMMLDRDKLLMRRYFSRGDEEKYEIQRQFALFERIYSFCDAEESEIGKFSWTLTVEEELRMNDLQLGLLNTFCNIKPCEKYPVTCDGEVDEWSGERVGLGFHRALILARMGEHDAAFGALEDAVSLLEKIFGLIIDGSGETAVTCRCEWLDRLSVKYKLISDGMIAKDVWIGECNLFVGNSGPTSLRYVLTTRNNGWDQFDAIRNDPRYQTYIDRAEKMCAICEKKAK